LKLGSLTLGEAIEPIEDFCDSNYPRRNGTVINLNPNSRTECKGCRFCYTNYQIPRDREKIFTQNEISCFVDDWLKKSNKKDLSHIIQVAVVTGCFDKEDEIIHFLLNLQEVLDKYNFKGEIFYFGSQITSKRGLEKLKAIKSFAYCLSIECFENREYFLRDKKRQLSISAAMDILKTGIELNYRMNFSYILGLEGIEVMEKGFNILKPYINSFPIINLLQVHVYHKDIRHREADYLEYYMNARMIIERIFDNVDYKPRTWENYRSPWYLMYNTKFHEGIRTP
jgi:hypothetical protein